MLKCLMLLNIRNSHAMRNALLFFLFNFNVMIFQSQALHAADFFLTNDSSDCHFSPKLQGGIEEGSDLLFFSISLKNNSIKEFKSDPDLKIVRYLKSAKILIVETSYQHLKKKYCDHPNITFIDLVNVNPKEEATLRQHNLNVNRIGASHHFYPGIKGQSQTVSLKENSCDTADIDLAGKILVNENSSPVFTQHAKEMGTLLIGEGNSSRYAKGVLPQSTILCTDFNSLFAEDSIYYRQFDIRVQNHSYGTGIENYYSNETFSYDQVVNKLPELVHVFSAGNAGSQTPQAGIYEGISGYANLTGNYKQSKNSIVVSSVDSANNWVSLSSSGPAYDGRLKPELVAFGGDGTSESAVLVSGTVGLLQQRFFELNGAYPISSTVKATLMAGAKDVHSEGIDFNTGYGSLHALHSLQILDSTWYYEDLLSLGEIKMNTINIPVDCKELKVVLSWIDPAAQPGAENALVHDLDLKVTSPENTLWLPWVLDSSPDADLLSLLPARKEDHLNTMEMVTIKDPVPGVYEISVSANALQSSQTFSIAYFYQQKNKFQWNYPTSSDKLITNTKGYLHWENTWEESEGELFVKYGKGDWTSLGLVELAKDHFGYQVYDTTSLVQFKMNIAGEEFYSEYSTITKELELSVENLCDQVVMLSWPEIEQINGYHVYQLKDGKMEKVLSTNDTIINYDFQGSAPYFAVAPQINDTIEGARSTTVNVNNSNKGCYLSYFSASLSNTGIVNISLGINAPWDIESIQITRSREGKDEVIGDFSSVLKKNYFWTDTDLIPGSYTYQAKITLLNGDVIDSERIQVYYTNENTVIYFPNPVVNDYVNVLSDLPGGEIHVFDSQGKLIVQRDIVANVETVDLTGYGKGIYLFQIHYNGQHITTGKIMKL